jgi:hypothetical protein
MAYVTNLYFCFVIFSHVCHQIFWSIHSLATTARDGWVRWFHGSHEYSWSVLLLCTLYRATLRYGKLFMVLIVYFYFASTSVIFNISDCKFSGASVYFMNWFCMAYFHVIIEVSPPVRTRIKKFAQILGMCFSNVFVLLFWVPSFLMLFFIHCSAPVSLCFLFGFLCFKVSWHAYDDVSVCPDLYYSFFIKNEWWPWTLLRYWNE